MVVVVVVVVVVVIVVVAARAREGRLREIAGSFICICHCWLRVVEGGCLSRSRRTHPLSSYFLFASFSVHPSLCPSFTAATIATGTATAVRAIAIVSRGIRGGTDRHTLTFIRLYQLIRFVVARPRSLANFCPVFPDKDQRDCAYPPCEPCHRANRTGSCNAFYVVASKLGR